MRSEADDVDPGSCADGTDASSSRTTRTLASWPSEPAAASCGVILFRLPARDPRPITGAFSKRWRAARIGRATSRSSQTTGFECGRCRVPIAAGGDMTDVLVYSPEYRKDTMERHPLRWHSNHRVFGDLLPGDRLWVITPGKSLGDRTRAPDTSSVCGPSPPSSRTQVMIPTTPLRSTSIGF